MEPTIHLRYQPALDGLRAFAVLAVIAYHDGFSWAAGGFLGVDAFFVLSGFLITSLLLVEWQKRGTIHLLAFWGRRARRLLPALLLVLAAVALYGYLVVPDVQLGRLRGDGLASLFYVANWRFVFSGQSYFDLFTDGSPLRHLWSLAIEEQFYLAWPLVVVAALRVARGSLKLLTALCVLGIVASALLMAILYSGGDPSRAYYGTDSRVHTILIGGLLALLLNVWQPHGRRAARGVQAIGAVGVLYVLWACYAMNDQASWYYQGGSVLYAVAVASVVAAIVQPVTTPLRVVLSYEPVRWIGLISYGLYLWHYPVNAYVTGSRFGIEGIALDGVRLALTFACATASYYLLELPIRRGTIARRLTWTGAPAGMAFVGVAFVTATVGAAPVPNYLGGGPGANGWRLACGPPSAELRAEADRAVQKVREPPFPALFKRVVIIGDSGACSLALGLRAAGEPLGMTITDTSMIGCGVSAGQVHSDLEETPAKTEECPAIMRDRISQAAANPTDAIMWMSSWERMDQIVDEKLVRFDTPEGRRLVLAQMEEIYQLLRARTPAPIFVLSSAAPGPGEYQDGGRRGIRSEDRRYTRLGFALAEFARRHPGDITYIDLARKICPSGPPCEALGDFNPRAKDGVHFSTDGSVWAAKWLIPRMVLAPRS